MAYIQYRLEWTKPERPSKTKKWYKEAVPVLNRTGISIRGLVLIVYFGPPIRYWIPLLLSINTVIQGNYIVKTKVFCGIQQSSLNNLDKFGKNLNVAIKHRNLRQKDIAEAALISIPTLRKAINGDPTVSIGVYLSIMSQLQLDDQIATLAEPCSDEIGMALAERNLPARIRVKEDKYDF